jgi:hypothetical protein
MKSPARKKIVFVNQSTGYLSIDIINAFAKDFDEVHLLYGELRVQDTLLDPKVRLTRVIKKSRRSHLTRFLAWSGASIQIFFLLLFRFRSYDIFYFTLPPFAYLSSLILPNRFSILIFDVYPDVLKVLGITPRNPIFAFWSWANRRLFQRAHRVYTIGNGLAKLMSAYTTSDKIHVIPLWSGLADAGPVPKAANPFLQQFQITDKFIVQYSGNIGAGNNIEALLDVAALLASDPSILFLIIGRGMKVPLVERLINERNLSNCLLLPFQPDEMLKYSLAAADLSVILVEEGTAEVSVPSKLFNLLKVGSSILAIGPANSEVNRIVKEYRLGECFEGKAPQQIASYVTRMKNSPDLSAHQQNAIEASRDFSPLNAQIYSKLYLDSES